jgi:O-antigen/teichoic acid export membrane protein
MGTPTQWDSPAGEDARAPEASTFPEGDVLSLPREEVMHRSLAGVFFLTSSSIINLVVGFGASLVLARLLTPGDFGVVAVGTTATLLGAALADGGLGAAMVRRPEPPTRAELRTMNGIQLTLALAVCLPVAAIALSFGRAGAVTAVMILSLPIVTLQTPGRITLSRAMRFDRQAAADAGSQVSSLTLTVLAVVLGAGVWGLAAGAVIKAIIATALINRLSGGFRRPSLRGWRGYGGVLLFGVKFQASFYTFLAREQGLNILLAVTAGVGSLGIWTFANRIFQLPSLAFNTLYVVGFPAISNILARGEEIGPIILRMVRRAAIVGTFIFGTFAAASPKLIPAVFGDQWREVASIIPFCCLSTILLGSISVAASSYLPAVGRPGIVAIASACLGVIWLGVTAAFLPTIGVAAIGIGNLAGAVVEAAVLNAATKRASGVALYRPLVRPLAVAVLSGGFGWLVCVEGPDGLLTAVGTAILTFTLAALGLWLVCRKDLAETLQLGFGSLRSAVPRLRRPSAQAV